MASEDMDREALVTPVPLAAPRGWGRRAALGTAAAACLGALVGLTGPHLASSWRRVVGIDAGKVSLLAETAGAAGVIPSAGITGARRPGTFEELESAEDVTFGDIARVMRPRVAHLGATDDAITESDWSAACDRVDPHGKGQVGLGTFGGFERVGQQGKLTKKACRTALATLVQWFPEMAYPLVEHEPLIVSLAFLGERAPADAPDVTSQLAAGSPASDPAAPPANTTECEEKAISLAIEVVLFVINLATAGTATGATAALSRAKASLVTELSPTLIKALAAEAHVLVEAYRHNNAHGMGEAVVAMFRELWNGHIVRACIDAIRAEMNWWDWATTGVTLVACLTLWLGSGGAVLAAQVALTILSATKLILAAIAVTVACDAEFGPNSTNST
uniref:Uncharacterized protein n=2 Tax=Zooxanthella nutricula TaxID=1333877 RepID=A0A7S2NRI4_9DINO